MSDLPKDFPARQKLINTGFVRYATVQNHRSWGSVRGLSGKDIKNIKAYLSGDKKELPEDLPGRDEFLDAGHNQLEDIKDISDYTKVKGIGPATAEKIKTYFEDN